MNYQRYQQDSSSTTPFSTSQSDEMLREASHAPSSAPLESKPQFNAMFLVPDSLLRDGQQVAAHENLSVQAQMMLMMQQQRQLSHFGTTTEKSGPFSQPVVRQQPSQVPTQQEPSGMMFSQALQPQQVQKFPSSSATIPQSPHLLRVNHAGKTTDQMIPQAPQAFLGVVPGVSTVLQPPSTSSLREIAARIQADEKTFPHPLHSSTSVADQPGDFCQKRRAPSKAPPRSAKGDEPEVMSSMDTASLLHNACKLYPETLAVVESALQMDPGAIRRKILMVCAKSTDNGPEERTADFYRKRQALEKYYYPFNIALKHNASTEVLDLLLRAGPDVLAEKDGPDEASSLAIAIELDRSVDVIKSILVANPRSARTVDRHANTPLHVLVRTQASNAMDLVRLVFRAHPQALKMQNFHRHTPIDVAVRKEVCCEEVVDFLQSQLFDEMEGKAKHLDDLVE